MLAIRIYNYCLRLEYTYVCGRLELYTVLAVRIYNVRWRFEYILCWRLVLYLEVSVEDRNADADVRFP